MKSRVVAWQGRQAESRNFAVSLLIGIYIIVGLFTPLGISSSANKFMLLGLLSLIALIQIPFLIKHKFSSRFIVIVSICIACSLVMQLIDNHQKTLFTQLISYTLIVFLVFSDETFTVPKCVYDFVFYVMSAGIAVMYLTFLSQYGFSFMFSTSDAIWPKLPGYPEVNNTAIAVFFYLWLSVKRKNVFGILLSIVFPAFYLARQYILMVILAVVLVVGCHFSTKVQLFVQKSVTGKNFVLAVCITTIAVVALSYFWLDVVVPQGVGVYKTTLNDESNAGRMAQDKYVFELLCSDPQFLLRGYDLDLFSILGISTTDFSKEANTYIYGMYRLAQPHEELLNMILKYGMLISLLYYSLIGHLLTIRCKGLDAAIVLSYLISSAFLHGMFETIWILLLFFSVSTVPKKVKWRFIKEETKGACSCRLV